VNVRSTGNLQMEIVSSVTLKMIAEEWERVSTQTGVRNPLPKVLLVQSDRGGDMSNTAWIGFWAQLVGTGLFDTVVVSHLPVAHSHTVSCGAVPAGCRAHAVVPPACRYVRALFSVRCCMYQLAPFLTDALPGIRGAVRSGL
jgi:hypothetical protein